MPDGDATSWLGGWEGYRVETIERRETDRREVWIYLGRPSCTPMICDGCGQTSERVHDIETRVVRDLPILDAATWISVPRRRVLCGQCGPRLERLDWLERHARVTRRLAESVVRLCRALPVKQVAAFFGLDWHTVKEIDKRALQRSLDPVDLSGIDLLAMDEFAIQRGHRYATVVIEPHTRRVLWVGRDRSREGVRPFFDLLGEVGCRRIKAVAMDMNAAYANEVRARCPQAEIVYDLFHVVAKYGHDVIDRVRVDEANRLRDDKKARKVIKTARWLLLRNRENLKRPEDGVRLDELLAANQALMTVYVLKEELKQLWRQPSIQAAQTAWQAWADKAAGSGIEPLVRFAKKLAAYLHGIVASAAWQLNTSVLEGINNRIKVIKRMAYGYRDDAYFFLKIRDAFPGKTR
ncbi:ISL3 family transposase [Nitrospirillum viridazoti]|nr:ISL3 family transposase [Nitrospirillum amazonense]